MLARILPEGTSTSEPPEQGASCILGKNADDLYHAEIVGHASIDSVSVALKLPTITVPDVPHGHEAANSMLEALNIELPM